MHAVAASKISSRRPEEFSVPGAGIEGEGARVPEDETVLSTKPPRRRRRHTASDLDAPHDAAPWDSAGEDVSFAGVPCGRTDMPDPLPGRSPFLACNTFRGMDKHSLGELHRGGDTPVPVFDILDLPRGKSSSPDGWICDVRTDDQPGPGLADRKDKKFVQIISPSYKMFLQLHRAGSQRQPEPVFDRNSGERLANAFG